MGNKKAKPRVVLFFICTFFFWSSIYTYVPTMTPYLVDFGISFSLIGLIGGSYGFSQMLMRIPLGIVSDKLGVRKRFIVLGVIIGTISTLGMYFTENAYVILFLRFLAGVAASSWVVFTILFTDYFEESKRASRISYLFMAHGMALTLSRLGGGYVANRFGHEYTFFLGAAAGIIAVSLSLCITEKAPEAKELPSVRSLFGVIKDKNLITMSVLGIFVQMILQSTINTFTPQAASEIGADYMQLGLLATAASIPSILASLVCGSLFSTRNVSVRLVLAVGFALQVAGILIIPITAEMTPVFVSTVIVGLGCGICMSTLLGFCTQTVDASRRSAAMGFFQAIYGFGMFIGPLIIGVFVDWIGLSGGFFLAAAVAATGLALTFVLIDKQVE